MQQKVSIIIPTYNRSDVLGETLDSILAQIYTNWECVLVDDGSTDYTAELSEMYCELDSRFKYFKRPSHLPKGANSCRNYGYSQSNGIYINWFDDDDVMLPEFIDSKVKFMTPDVNLIICSFIKVDAFLRNESPVFLHKRFKLFKSYALYELKMVTNSVLFRRNILEERELFNPKVSRGEETEFFLRIFFDEPEESHYLLNYPLFLYRQHKLSKTIKSQETPGEFLYSLMFIAFQFLTRGAALKDVDIIKFHYKKSISLFFRSIDAGQTDNTSFYLKNIQPIIWKFNKILSIEILFWGQIFIWYGRSFYRIENRLKHYLG